jgi:hypothetical protein
MEEPKIEGATPVELAGARTFLRVETMSWLLLVIAVAYAFIAGLQTVGDFDLGWQLAAGRYVVQHHTIPSTDVFSYTAAGKRWIYPPLSGVVFYLLYCIAGFSALSLFNAIASAGTVLLCMDRRRPWSALLAIVAVPLIASRTEARADAFTVLLFAAFLRIVWIHLRGGKAPLWLLPVLMVAWVNLHLGFLAGFGVLIGYVLAESVNFATGDGSAKARLRTAAPSLALTVLATVVNRWGVFLYQALLRQNAVSQAHTRFVGEWHRQPITWSFLAQALRWRDPASGFWWLLFAAIVCAAIALFRKKFAAAGFLFAAVYVGVSHLRFQALFAIVVIIVAGEMWEASRKHTLVIALAALAIAFTIFRVADVVDNRAHLSSSEITTFGVGGSWWFPQDAADFVLHNRAPGQVFNTYDQGGFLMFRLYPEYRDYVDGRAVPFGMEFLDRGTELLNADPDSAEWAAEAQRWNIQTMILPASRYAGVEKYPFDAYCKSTTWTPVYLDDTGLVLVRNSAENQAFVDQHKIDCRTVKLLPSARQQSSAALLYNFYANRAAIDYLLERDDEALESYRLALHIFDGDPNLHLAIGQLYQVEGKNSDAEGEYRTSIALRPTDLGWYALGRLYASEHRYDEAVQAIKLSAALSYDPAPRYRALEQLQRMQSK